MKIADWFVIAMIALACIAGTAYLFIHPSDGNFLVWCGFWATVGGLFHFLSILDDKRADQR